MPKATSDFKDMQDYKEAVLGASKEKDVYFGSRALLKIYYQSIDQDDEHSRYFGRVFYPERKTRKDIDLGFQKPNFSYEKNKAFWAGIIDSRQKLTLITDIVAVKKGLGGTLDEILWLQDNGYTFRPDPHRPTDTLVDPPEIPKKNPSIVHYMNGLTDLHTLNGLAPSESNKQEMDQRFKVLQQQIQQARKQLKTQDNQSNVSSSRAPFLAPTSITLTPTALLTIEQPQEIQENLQEEKTIQEDQKQLKKRKAGRIEEAVKIIEEETKEKISIPKEKKRIDTSNLTSYQGTFFSSPSVNSASTGLSTANQPQQTEENLQIDFKSESSSQRGNKKIEEKIIFLAQNPAIYN